MAERRYPHGFEARDALASDSQRARSSHRTTLKPALSKPPELDPTPGQSRKDGRSITEAMRVDEIVSTR